jgi:SAM-dependent methyltransferase
MWYKDFFGEDYLAIHPELKGKAGEEAVRRQTDSLEEMLSISKGGRILDLCCGHGRFTTELERRGYKVIGLDLSWYLLQFARKSAIEDQMRSYFVKADMRALPFGKVFDGVISLFTSFGYFSDQENIGVVKEVVRVLKPGGRFLIDLANRDALIRDLKSRHWEEGDGCIYLITDTFNPLQSVLETKRIVLRQSGEKREYTLRIRLYSIHEVIDVLRRCGLRILGVSDGWERHFFDVNTSLRMVVVSEKTKT